MSLIVSAFWRDPSTGEIQEFTDTTQGHQMAGPESARQELWGSQAVRRRGATHLPKLAENNLWVEPEELDSFVAEVQALLDDVDGLQADLGGGPTLPHYLNNLLSAATYARARNGGVNIT